MQSFIQDLRYARRQLRHSLGFGATVIAVLALSIGVTSAVFSVLYATLIQPLPYADPNTIAALAPRSPQGYTQPASYPEYTDWRQMNHSFDVLAGYSSYGSVNFEGPAGPTALRSVQGTDNFFDVFGVSPLLGRTFAPGEDRDGSNDVAVLSYEVWRDAFGRDKSAIGRQVRLDGRPYTIIGVMPAGFRFPINRLNAIYTPLHMSSQQRQGRGNHWLQTVGRLRPGVSAKQAEADMTRVLTDLGRTYPDSQGRSMELPSLSASILGKTGGSLTLLSGAVLALLLIGCVNLAGLLLARGVKREREVALRTAVGANRLRIVRQMLTEALLFAVCGAATGVALAYGLLHAIRLLLVSALARGAGVQLNLVVLAASLAVSVTVTILAALMPALRLSGTAPSLALRAGGSAGVSRGQHRLRAAFVIAQTALALVLLVVSGLLIHLLAGLKNSELGFSPDHILVAEVDLSSGRYEGRDVMADFYQPLFDRVRAIPGVQSVGIIQVLPIQNWGWNSDVHVAGMPPAPPHTEQLAELRIISPGFYDVFQDRLVRGRLFDASLDTPKSKFVTVVNEAFVKKFIPDGSDPIGMHLDDDDKTMIIGVVKNIRQNIYEPPLAEMDLSSLQVPQKEGMRVMGSMSLVVRTSVAPESIIRSLRQAYFEIDPTLPFRAPETMPEVLADTLIFERMENWLFGTFAGLAVLLAIVGLFGLISHEVELSRRDIGVRMALGESRWGILTGVYRRVGYMLGAGVLAGLLLTWPSRRYIDSVVPLQPENNAGRILTLAALLIAAGLLAALLPARRAASMDPMEALREE
jgi:predicted permease